MTILMSLPHYNVIQVVEVGNKKKIEFDYLTRSRFWLRRQEISHMSNTLDQIPVDKTTSPMESSRKMKPEVQ